MLLFSHVSRILRIPFSSASLVSFRKDCNTMNQQAALQTRAILLEKFKGGVKDVNLALEDVELELGPNLITYDSAAQLFQKFKNGDEDISDGASDHESQMLRNGTFLNTKRALCCELPLPEHATSTPIFGTDGRYQIYSSTNPDVNVLVDTFHGIKKKLQVNWKSAVIDVFGKKMLRYVMFCSKNLLAIHHVDETNVLGTVRMYADRDIISLMFRGKMDYQNATLDIEKLVNHVYDFEQCIFTDSITNQLLMLIYNKHGWKPDTKFAEIDFSDGNVAFKNDIILPYILTFPILRDGKLFGFLDTERRTNFENLVEISLADATKKEFEVTLENGLDLDIDQFNPYLWIDNKLLVASEMNGSEIYEFDLTNRKWTKSTIQVEGTVRSMSIADNVLIVHAFQTPKLTQQFYRFPFGGKESPEIETWLKIRRRVLFHPNIPSRPSWAGDTEETLNEDEE